MPQYVLARDYTPREYQKLIANRIITTPRCSIWAGMGMGKSAATLQAISTLALIEDIFPVLILAPLRVAKTTWPDEVAKWKDFEQLRITPIVGSEKERLAALHTPSDIYTTNYESIQWLQEELGDNWPFKMVVADESTKLKGFRLRQGTKRARALAKVAHTKVKRFVNLTGTPSPNGLQDLWGQQWFIDQGNRLGRTYDSFSQRWFYKGYDGFSIKPQAYAQAQIQGKLQDVCLSLNAADYFDLQDPIVNTIQIELPPSARKLYKQMEDNMFMEIEEQGVEAVNAAVKTSKCLQLANGAAYIGEDAKDWAEIHDAKLKALEDIIEEAAGMPALVAYNFRSDLERIQAHFPKARKLDANPKTIAQWNAGEIPILLAHPASAGHGLNLQDGGNIMVFFGLNWNLEEHQQIIERIGPTRQMQAGHKRAVFIHHIVAKDTVDSLVLSRLSTKRSVQDILLDAMKTRREANANS